MPYKFQLALHRDAKPDLDHAKSPKASVIDMEHLVEPIADRALTNRLLSSTLGAMHLISRKIVQGALCFDTTPQKEPL